MVSLAELPPPSRDALMRLEAAVREAIEPLGSVVSVVGRGAIEKGEDPYASMRGGVLGVLPGHSPLPNGAGDLRQLFQEVIHHAPGLRVVVVHGTRNHPEDAWMITHKLVAGVEVDALRKGRGSVDKRLRAALERLRTDASEDVLFGRFYDSNDVKLVHGDPGRGSEQASPELLELFEEAARIYQVAGFELTHAIWQLRGRRSTGTGFKAWEVEDSFV